ncbi:MAG TPA: hypothetical protein VGF79_12985 [Bacteroidia bacterium]
MKHLITIALITLLIGCKKEHTEGTYTIEVSNPSELVEKNSFESGMTGETKVTVKSTYEGKLTSDCETTLLVNCDSGTNLIVKINGTIRYNKWNYHHEYKVK